VFRFCFTASAVNGVPSLNVTPERILIVHVRRSALSVHEVARRGTGLPSAYVASVS
jgi:hypothetical protein